MMITVLATIALILAFITVLVLGVVKIMWSVEGIGSGPTSSPPPLLGQIRWGVRAIERQTYALVPHVHRLASSLVRLEGALERLSGSLRAWSRRT
jgi:hypothetical protein